MSTRSKPASSCARAKRRTYAGSMTGPADSRISDSSLVPIMPMNSTGMRCLPLLGCFLLITLVSLDPQEGLVFCAGVRVAVLRDRQAEVAAQGGGLVLGAHDAALLQDRDDLLAEAAPLAGVVDEEAEPVERTAVEPLLDPVGDRRRG